MDGLPTLDLRLHEGDKVYLLQREVQYRSPGDERPDMESTTYDLILARNEDGAIGRAREDFRVLCFEVEEFWGASRVIYRLMDPDRKIFFESDFD